jgi:hypothetical protein
MTCAFGVPASCISKSLPSFIQQYRERVHKQYSMRMPMKLFLRDTRHKIGTCDTSYRSRKDLKPGIGQLIAV